MIDIILITEKLYLNLFKKLSTESTKANTRIFRHDVKKFSVATLTTLSPCLQFHKGTKYLFPGRTKTLVNDYITIFLATFFNT